MTTKITATFSDGGESTVRTITLPHDVDDRVGELIGLGLLAELDSPNVFKDPAKFDIEVYRERGSSLPCEYAVGDTIEVVDRPDGHNYGPPVGHRADVVEVSDFSTLCIPWDVEGFDGFWLSYDQVQRVDKPASDLHEHTGETSTAAPELLAQWALDRWDRWAISVLGLTGTITQHGREPLREKIAERLRATGPVQDSTTQVLWSEPSITPDGTKTFTAPGVTMVEHPPEAGSDFPTWTITADAPSEPIDAPQSEKVAPAGYSTREAMRDAGLPDWEMGKGVSAADAIRELARQRDEARERLAKQDTHARYSNDGRTRVAHDLRAFAASARWTESTTHGIELSTEDAIKLLTLAEKAR